ncbi:MULTISPECIES: hypothetical protein [Erysipelotrichaceae]|uniref:Uncharacterized protein n=1 Tax=[Eubacterium] hominis TaxID=2764325 RepID=A0A7G9GNP1_9FIRM|nr:hypothetical protein [Absiella sp. AM27-20]QNM12423.1 hypothetical protein H9Q80_00255 [[Eubacterium] hominis]RHU10669.1 hypothetical protein DW716_01220 [Absiella sp. AM27-20]
MGAYKIAKWWRKNAWRARVSIYTALVSLPRLLVSIIEALETIYEEFIAWLLWKALNFIFKYRAEEDD